MKNNKIFFIIFILLIVLYFLYGYRQKIKMVFFKNIFTKDLIQNSAMIGDYRKNSTYVVVYSDEGFVPDKIKIRRGQSVDFINKSSFGMQIISTDENILKKYIDQPKIVLKEGVYSFNFGYEGVWNFTNKINTEDVGSIEVF